MASTAFVPSTAPTHQTYSELQQAYDHFNDALFEGKLPHCLITLQREKRTVRFLGRTIRITRRRNDRRDRHQPSYFAVVSRWRMQTLVHEMAHLWQHILSQ
jgi:hypothetical protein